MIKKMTNNDDAEIKCIFLCEFHSTVGTKIIDQSPKNFITKEDFDKISNYVIPKVQLQRCFISISLNNLKILGFPIRIDNKSYVRNAFYFNLCFVFDPMSRTFGHEPIIRKCAEYLLSLELSSKFLSQLDDSKARRLENMLDEIRIQINLKRHCMLKDGASILPLCIVPYYGDCDQIENTEFAHKAPVLLDCFYEDYKFEWDLTTRRIVPYINGFRHIDKIAMSADVSVTIVVQCVRHLILLGVAILVPVFQYSNIYRPTPKLNILAKSPEVQKRAIERCSKSEIKKAKIRDILLLFASMTHGATLGELCVRFNPAKHNIDERKTVLFGLIEQLIRPIYKYPVAVSKNLFVGYEDLKTSITNNSFCIPISNKKQSVDNVKITRNAFTGLKTLDEICMKTACGARQLEEQLSCDKHVIILLK
ncbi:CLUMA_CG008981, isoform A [Clunio marinus]|uniref:CLUMA_CG008981, isoform A n=1 Tax=Clunio marinus TaxID=568069 RepID=A0A1J1I5F3_9DIPT|nr:CLUMA_CG008981, isoform A [Clunio marinus]